MRTFLMEVECSRVQDQCRIFNRSMLRKVSKDSNSKATKKMKTKAKEVGSFEDQMLSFIGENKRLLNVHEHNFDELTTF